MNTDTFCPICRSFHFCHEPHSCNGIFTTGGGRQKFVMLNILKGWTHFTPVMFLSQQICLCLVIVQVNISVLQGHGGQVMSYRQLCLQVSDLRKYKVCQLSLSNPKQQHKQFVIFVHIYHVGCQLYVKRSTLVCKHLLLLRIHLIKSLKSNNNKLFMSIPKHLEYSGHYSSAMVFVSQGYAHIHMIDQKAFCQYYY